MTNNSGLTALALLSYLFVAGCGGSATTAVAPPPPGTAPTDAQRSAAATATANSNALCAEAVLGPYYWEIGDRNSAKVSGTRGSSPPTASTVMAIASSSKWIYSTYVLQKLGSAPRTSDVPFLHFTSGYVFPPSAAGGEVVCRPSETVGECAADVAQNTAAIDKFFYSAGHFQYHATNVMGLGSMGAAELTTEITSQVGAFDFLYLQTNLAGGLNASASGYAGFLRRMLRGEFVMASQLGSNKVCASSACSAGAVLSPAPDNEAWNYSLGHWVEDDPAIGDHAFSSAGALGFYPWIDSTKTYYGIIARRSADTGSAQAGVVSLNCGRLIRQAWITGVAVSSTLPTPAR